MSRVTVLILHPEPGADAGRLTRALADARSALTERHRRSFLAVGADEVRVESGPRDDTPFGARLRALLPADPGRPGDGLIVLGSGAVPLATADDRRRFVAVARTGTATALANNRYSADVVAVGRVDALAGLPDLRADNALPRWLEEVAGVTVADLRDRWRLALDLDSPLDAILLSGDPHSPAALRRFAAALPVLAGERLAAVARRLRDRRAEVLVAGRTSAASLRWLETGTAARIRALVEERGLRAADRLGGSNEALGVGAGSSAASPRPPASALGMLLDRDGPGALGALVARLADAAVVDTRVLLAHRLGSDEPAWPSPEDRYASDLLEPDEVHDPWLRELTRSAVRAPVPIALGGHTLVGPGVRLVARRP